MLLYYQEITLIPDGETPAFFLMSRVFVQIHLALGNWKNQTGSQPFGISFPQYEEKSLGEKIRIFAESRELLEKLDMEGSLKRLKDYVHLTSIRKVPMNRITGYASFSRYQPDSSVKQKARRFSARHPSTSYEEALSQMKQKKEDYGKPFIHMKSLSGGQKFNLFIAKTPQAEEMRGFFSTYGLSRDASLPEFLTNDKRAAGKTLINT